MSDRIRVGIVGATVTAGGSGWGAHAHVPALNALPEYELKAVCTAHEETAKASAAAFGAELAFSDFDRLLEHPDIDLVAVVVRVPEHYDLTVKALRAGKATFCEWPLGANVAEAEELAHLTRTAGVSTFVGLQARSDPAVRAARELIDAGYVGEIVLANLSVVLPGQYVRGAGRSWQSQRKNGANPLTIQGGHSIDATRYLIGEFVDVAARVTTQTRQWLDSDTGQTLDVDAPDTIGVVARTQRGAEVTVQIATVPTAASGFRLEIYGTAGRLVLTSHSNVSNGPNQLRGAKGKDALTDVAIPPNLILAPPALAGAPPSVNVANAYARYAADRVAGRTIDPDFETALSLHRLIGTIERAAG